MGAEQVIIQELIAGQNTYQPSAETKQLLADKTLIMLVGATCMGKSTVMYETMRQNPDIRVVGTRTTRNPRSDDDRSRYTYRPNTTDGLRSILTDVQRQSFVQYAVNPHNDTVYWSEPSDYDSTVCIGDYFSDVVESFKTYGFRVIMPMTVITDPHSWQQRLDERFPPHDSRRPERLREAMDSLHWSLGQPDGHPFIVNQQHESHTAAASVISAIHGEVAPYGTGKALAAACLALAERLCQS